MASSAAPVDFASGNHYTVLGVAHNASEAERKPAELEIFCMFFLVIFTNELGFSHEDWGDLTNEVNLENFSLNF